MLTSAKELRCNSILQIGDIRSLILTCGFRIQTFSAFPQSSIQMVLPLPFYTKKIKATLLAILSFNNTHLINDTSHYYISTFRVAFLILSLLKLHCTRFGQYPRARTVRPKSDGFKPFWTVSHFTEYEFHRMDTSGTWIDD